jgi:hypothetical protein
MFVHRLERFIGTFPAEARSEGGVLLYDALPGLLEGRNLL